MPLEGRPRGAKPGKGRFFLGWGISLIPLDNVTYYAWSHLYGGWRHLVLDFSYQVGTGDFINSCHLLNIGLETDPCAKGST
jgi:hypothetical protein